MLVLHPVDLADAIALFCEDPPLSAMTPTQCAAFCKERGLLGFAAEEDGELAGFAVAESHPRRLEVLNLEGTAPACRLLLHRLVLLAGERDVSGWFPAGRPDVLRMVEEVGFRRQFRDDSQGRPAYLYYWSRNEDVGGPRGE